MYIAKCCPNVSLISLQNVVLWNELITSYVNNNRSEKALACFEQMRLEGVITPDSITFTCVLKACALSGSLIKGCEIHVEVVRNGLLKENAFVGNMMVGMYVKCGCLDKAKQVFDMIMERNVVTWTSLMAGYTHHKKEKEALYCLEEMQIEGILPNRVTIVCSLRSCSSIRAIKEGCEIHVMVISKGLESDISIGNSLVGMYSKCGMLDEAYDVFVKLHVWSMVTWGALIDGYIQYDRGHEALICLEMMQIHGIFPNVFTLACILKACADVGRLVNGIEIHGEIARKELALEKNVFVVTALVYMYAKCGSLIKAQEVFDMLLVRDLVAWNALIGGYAQIDHHDKVLRFFEQMQLEGVFPDSVMLACIMKSCDVVKGIEMHAKFFMLGVMKINISLGSALVDMYGKYGMLTESQEAFNMLHIKNVITWNSLIGAYVCHGYSKNAIQCYLLMQMEDIPPDSVTFIYVLKACADSQNIDKGNDTYTEISQRGFLKTDLCVGNALVDMYSKFGSLMKAQEVFEILPLRDEITWNILISGFVQYDHAQEALECFEQMQHEGLMPNSITFTCILKACGSIGVIDKGEILLVMVARLGLLEEDPILASALIDMYAKCGLLMKAQEVLDMVRVRNIVTWNTLVSGYSQLGEMKNVIFVFNTMLEETNEVDALTFLGVLSACSHGGLLDDGFIYLRLMHTDYNIIPSLSHYTCMIDLLGRAGQLDLMMTIMEDAPFHPSIIMWLAVLGACRKWGNVQLGRHAFEQVLFLHENDVAAHICMHNIYADFEVRE